MTIAPGATETLVAVNVLDLCIGNPPNVSPRYAGTASITGATYTDPDTTNNTASVSFVGTCTPPT